MPSATDRSRPGCCGELARPIRGDAAGAARPDDDAIAVLERGATCGTTSGRGASAARNRIPLSYTVVLFVRPSRARSGDVGRAL